MSGGEWDRQLKRLKDVILIFSSISALLFFFGKWSNIPARVEAAEVMIDKHELTLNTLGVNIEYIKKAVDEIRRTR